MSVPPRRGAHPLLGSPRAPALALAALIPLGGALLVRAAFAIDAPFPVMRLDAAEAGGAGAALTLVSHPDLPGSPLEVLASDGAAPGVLLDAAPGGSSVALASVIGPGETSLTLARADGSQVQVPIEGALAATFAPDGSWLAVVDGLGRLWAMAADDAGLRHVADGPFIDAPIVDADGAIIALAVPSVEAPFRSNLVRVDPNGGAQQRLSDEELVYDAARLTDGSLAVVAHRPEGTVILRIADGRATRHADLGPGAVNVALSADGRVIAWEAAGEILVSVGNEAGRSLGIASGPAVGADGSAILMQRDGAAVLVDTGGRELAELARASALLDCAAECVP